MPAKKRRCDTEGCARPATMYFNGLMQIRIESVRPRQHYKAKVRVVDLALCDVHSRQIEDSGLADEAIPEEDRFLGGD